MNGGVDSQWKKTQSVFFTSKRIDERLIIRMYGKEIETVGTITFLGVHFDSRLTWAEHIRRVEEKSKKVINVMRCLTGREWGASCQSLKIIYVALIRSAMDYGSIVYTSAARSHLKKLDVIQTQALRVCSGAFKTLPVSAIQVEVGEMPLEVRKKHLIANYWVNLQGAQ